jgi:hypothetical protein
MPGMSGLGLQRNEEKERHSYDYDHESEEEYIMERRDPKIADYLIKPVNQIFIELEKNLDLCF